VSLDLNLLPILFAVYETRSVGEAAQKLGMSQPGLSTALKRARIALQDPLFLRTAHGMEPTARTRELIEPIQTILSTVENKVTAAPTFVPSQSSDEFRIALSDIGEAVCLPRLIRWMEAHAPNAMIRALSYKPHELVAEMEKGRVDLAVGYFPDFKGGEIFQQVAGTNSFSCIIRANHPIRSKRLTLEQFTSLKHAVVEAEGRGQEVFEQFLRREKIRRNVVLRTPHFMSIPNIIATTDLIVTIPKVLADVAVRQGGVKLVKTTFTMPTYVTKVHWHRTVHNSPKNRWLRRALTDIMRSLVAFDD
jgi:DNA-binding transcriptional LysR family regulator